MKESRHAGKCLVVEYLGCVWTASSIRRDESVHAKFTRADRFIVGRRRIDGIYRSSKKNQPEELSATVGVAARSRYDLLPILLLIRLGRDSGDADTYDSTNATREWPWPALLPFVPSAPAFQVATNISHISAIKLLLTVIMEKQRSQQSAYVVFGYGSLIFKVRLKLV